MKKVVVQGLFIAGIIGLIFNFSSCNSSSKSKNSEEVEFDQEAYDNQLQGVFEYLPPNQGMSAMFDNHFIFVFGDSDATMVCQGGTYTTSGDKVEFTTQYASNPELVGSIINWSPVFMDNDSLKTILFDADGNISSEFYNIRKVKVDEQTINQMKEWEGVYRYPAPANAMGIVFGGYILYGGQMGSGVSGTAAKYEQNNDTVKVKRLFTLDPSKKGTEFRWINESMNGDTLNWATINNAGEVLSRGKSVYLK